MGKGTTLTHFVRIVCWGMLPSAMGGLSGCGPSENKEVGIIIDASTVELPMPEDWRSESVRLDSKQMQRAKEVERLLIKRYQGYRVLATTQTYAGDIVDWIDPVTVPGAEEEPPPPVELQFPDETTAMLTELEAYPELRGPAGTVAMIRPTFSRYVLGDTPAASLTEFLEEHQ